MYKNMYLNSSKCFLLHVEILKKETIRAIGERGETLKLEDFNV